MQGNASPAMQGKTSLAVLTNLIRNDEDIITACAALAVACPKLAVVINSSPPPPLRLREGNFIGLARIIVFQQISIAAGGAIWDKFLAVAGEITPTKIIQLSEDELRAGGLSRPKIRTLKALSDAILSGKVTNEHLETGDNDALTAISGIGPWTVQVYQLSCVGDADVFPAGDLALQEALKDVFGLEARPGEKQSIDLVAHWKPYRAVGARLLWAHYTFKKTQKVNSLPV